MTDPEKTGEDLTARRFTARLEALASPDELAKIRRYFKTGEGGYAEGDVFLGVKMGEVFALAKEFIDLPLPEIDELLDSPLHEVRAGALSIMDKQARRKRTPAAHRTALYELYLRRLDRIDNWDLVDLAAPHVIGGHLADKPREPLYHLARATDVWARRTAVYAALHLVRLGDLDDLYGIAEILLADDHDLIHKAVGGVLREAGKKDRPRLLSFLDAHAAAMPRTMLRHATEHLDQDLRTHYRRL
ncbi:DNA alkylation repair enzyme [Actinocorallia herbida]|uniref:DNA alkylation repair enzyme n=1 Tax=Actinocorallia herbida TaxID=58109 RepID=A0A3N1CNQ8_9ACTN|nr:DNA alkylation repair protein [Actinocorallia herbida]ROO82959.1 DNA alkylation repair enzyme [Actinocorallia herbida]